MNMEKARTVESGKTKTTERGVRCVSKGKVETVTATNTRFSSRFALVTPAEQPIRASKA